MRIHPDNSMHMILGTAFLTRAHRSYLNYWSKEIPVLFSCISASHAIIGYSRSKSNLWGGQKWSADLISLLMDMPVICWIFYSTNLGVTLITPLLPMTMDWLVSVISDLPTEWTFTPHKIPWAETFYRWLRLAIQKFKGAMSTGKKRPLRNRWSTRGAILRILYERTQVFRYSKKSELVGASWYLLFFQLPSTN